ncbi:MAG TPA: hypothetical protein VEF06_10025 [Bryobacteraceae bacterium]|nr:hypothetical protein [Bryobacteraceae bacterium]
MFHEEQKLSSRRMKIQLALLPAGFTILLLWQVILKHPQAQNKLSNREVIGWTILLWLLYFRLNTVKMVTDLKPPRLTVRLRGVFRSCKIPLAEIESVEVISFDPFRDFGGFGIRATRDGRACIASGTRGVRVNLRNGRLVVIGSQQPEALAAAIEARENSQSRR